MSNNIHWDDAFLDNLKKGFEPLFRNDVACVVMEADSALMWVMLRDHVSEPYHLVWKLAYRQWKDLMEAALHYAAYHRAIQYKHCVCRYHPVGQVWLEHDGIGWVFKATFPQFIKALQQADQNILKLTSLTQ
jgi:hypothetical protein